MTSVLVTGASGFIGRHVTSLLKEARHDVVEATSADGDVAEASTWERYPAARAVIHLAARSFVPDSWKDPPGFLRANLLGTLGALEYARKHGARLVFLSSYMYGVPTSLPIAEDAAIDARNPYALSKKLAEEACRFYAASLGVGVSILRPFNVFGPGQGEAFLIPSIVGQIRAGTEIRVKDLAPRRDYVFVRDVADAIVRSMHSERDFAVYNVGSGVSTSVADLITLVQHVWRTSLPVHSTDERRRDEIPDTVADISAARRDLGWSPATSLRQGLEAIRRAEQVPAS